MSASGIGPPALQRLLLARANAAGGNHLTLRQSLGAAMADQAGLGVFLLLRLLFDLLLFHETSPSELHPLRQTSGRHRPIRSLIEVI